MRICTTKSANSEHVYVVQSYRRGGKSTSRIYRKLGSMDELLPLHGGDRGKVMEWAEEQARICTKEYEEGYGPVALTLYPNRPIASGERRSFNCGYLFLQSICSSLRLRNICRNISSRHSYDFDLEAIFSDLVYARFLDPGSKAASYEFAKGLLEPPKYGLHDVYRALSVLAEESDYVQEQLYRNSNFLHRRNASVLYYDCTNYYFEVEEETGLLKYGKSKENRPNPLVGMGLFMDGDGYPLAFGTYPGSANEQTTLRPLEEKVLRDFGCAEFIYCSDSGLGSRANKMLNHAGGRGYVVAQSLKKLKEEDRALALDPRGFRKSGTGAFADIRLIDEEEDAEEDAAYYKILPLGTKGLDEALVVTYSPKYKRYQRSVRTRQVERARKMIGEGGKPKKNRKNPSDPARFIRRTAVTEGGEAASEEHCEIDWERIKEEEKYDGFYAVATDLDGSPEEIIAINKRRWRIEECFRIMKTDFEARPVYLRRDERIHAHFLVCFTALLVYRILEGMLGKEYTTDEIVGTLRGMEVVDLEGYGYVPAYERTELTDKLHGIFGFRTDAQIIRKKTMRSIISGTKKPNKQKR